MNQPTHACCGPGYASPEEAIKAEREKVLYAIALYTRTGIEEPDYLATVDVDPTSPTYSKVIHRTPMPYMGDELHHLGWNACSSCHGDASKTRKFCVIPGQRSSRIYIVDIEDLRTPKIHKVIEPEQVFYASSRKNIFIHHIFGGIIDVFSIERWIQMGKYKRFNITI